MVPELNRRRAVLVLGKIDEILSWEKTKGQEKDTRFVELGEYLREVRSKQYWRLQNKIGGYLGFLLHCKNPLPAARQHEETRIIEVRGIEVGVYCRTDAHPQNLSVSI